MLESFGHVWSVVSVAELSVVLFGSQCAYDHDLVAVVFFVCDVFGFC